MMVHVPDKRVGRISMYFENLSLDFWLAASEICYILIHEGDKLDSDDICPR